MKALESAPSPKIRLNKLGNLNAILTPSAISLVPNNDAINNSLARPKMREIRVKNAMVMLDRNNINYPMNDRNPCYLPLILQSDLDK